MITAALPARWSSPAAMAISLPKLRQNDSAVTRGSAALSSRATCSVRVAGAVVDEDDFEVLDARQRRDEAFEQGAQIVALVEHGDDDRKLRRVMCFVRHLFRSQGVLGSQV